MLNDVAEIQFDQFYTELKRTESEDAVLTSKDQIKRLLRPGSTYFNLNPYDVLLVAEDESLDNIRKKYRRLSILVHPDKNPDDRDDAQKAFDVLKKALEMLENPNHRARIRLIYEEGKARTDKTLAEQRRLLKKSAPESNSFNSVPEENSELYKKFVWMNTIRVFAEQERKRRTLMEREMEEKKRARVEADEAKEKLKKEKEWQKTYEESREKRVSSWKNFKTKKNKGGFRPPKHKAESRA